MHSKPFKQFSTLAITSIFAMQSLAVFATEDPEKIIVVGTKPKPSLPGCMDLGTCTPGDPSPREPGSKKPPAEVAKIAEGATPCGTTTPASDGKDPYDLLIVDKEPPAAAFGMSSAWAEVRKAFTQNKANFSVDNATGQFMVTYSNGQTQLYQVTTLSARVIPVAPASSANPALRPDCKKVG